MAFTQADIDALKKAIANGARTVQYADGRAVTYRSLDEVRQLLVMMQDDVASSSSGGFNSHRTSVAGF